MRKWKIRISAAILSTMMTASMPLSALADVNTEDWIAKTSKITSEAKIVSTKQDGVIEEETTRGKSAAADETPAEETTEEAPVKETAPTEEVTEEAPAEETTEEASIEEAAPAEEVTEEAPEEETPAEETTEEAPIEETAPAEEVTEEIPEEEAPAEEITEEAPIEETAPAEETIPTLEAQMENVLDQIPTEETAPETLPENSIASQNKVHLIFTEDTVELKPDETVAALDLLTIPEGYEEIDIEWSSSDDTIAVVDEEGIITAVSAGSCVITAYLVGEDASDELTVIVQEAMPEYTQIDSLTEEMENENSPSREVLSEEELEENAILAEDAENLLSGYNDIAEQTEQQVQNGIMTFASTNYHDGIVVEPDFVNSTHVRGEEMIFPFKLFCFGRYYGERYYMEVYDSSGKLVAYNNGTFPYQLKVIDLTVTWTPTVPAGTYYLRFWSSGRKYDTYNSLARFYIVEDENIAAPKISKIVNTVQGSHVYWNKVSGATNYTVYRSTSKTGFYKRLITTSAVHYTDTTVESGKTYYYKIKANKGSIQSGASAAMGIVFVDTPDLTLRVNRSVGIGLGWNKITGATGYAIYRKTTGSWVRVATISGNNTFTWNDTSVKSKNGTVYHYTIRALAGSNMKTLSGCRNTGRTMVRLFTPTISSAVKASSTSLKATWNRNSSATGYEVRLMVDSNVYKTYTYGNNKTIVKTIIGLPSGKTYKVQVRSYKKVSGVGSFYSAWSAAKYVTLK